MIQKERFHILNFIKKEEYSGSMKGMRYLLRREEKEEGACIQVIIWPEPFCFGKTPEEKKQRKEFPFHQQGLDEAADWLNEQYTLQKDLWEVYQAT